MLKVLIIEDHPLFREALAHVVSTLDDTVECIEAETLEEGTRLLGRGDPFDLVLLDLGLPGVSGLSGVLSIRDQTASTPVVIVSASDDGELVGKAMRFGVSGFLPKSTHKKVMAAALTTVLGGGTYFPTYAGEGALVSTGLDTSCAQSVDSLTARQLTVLRLLGEGKSNKQIAYELSISQETVKIHISAILRKLGVNSRTQAVLAANRLTGRS